MSTEKISVDQFIDIAPMILDCGNPIYLRGRHGIGKSQLVKQVADLRKKKMIEVRLSQIGEGEIIGLPVAGDNDEAVHYRPMHWMLQAANEPCMLFFDEIDRASKSIRQATFQIADSRRVHQLKLHPETDIIVAGNAGDDASAYAVEPMDPAELSRYFTFEFEPTVPEWLHWARLNDVNPLVIGFIQNDHAALDWYKIEDNVPHPTRRGWTRLAHSMTKAGWTTSSSVSGKTNKKLMQILASSVIGQKHASAFVGWIERQIERPTVKDLLEGKILGKTALLTFEQVHALIEEMRRNNPFVNVLSKTEVENILDFAESLPNKETTAIVIQLSHSSEIPANVRTKNQKTTMSIDFDKLTGVGRWSRLVAQTYSHTIATQTKG